MKGTVEQLGKAGKPIGLLASDPSLHGVMELISAGAGLVQGGHLPASAMAQPMAMLSATLDQVLAGHFASFSWRDLLAGKPSAVTERREFIEIDPKLDFKSVQPGPCRGDRGDPGSGRRFAARARSRRDGAADRARADQRRQFLGAWRKARIPGLVGTIGAVLAILWLALRSGRIIGGGRRDAGGRAA